MKKILLVGGAALVLVAAGLVSYGLYRKHEGRDVRGSSTVEFVTTQAGEAQAEAGQQVRLADVPLRPVAGGRARGDPGDDPAAVPAALVLRRALAGRVPARRRVRAPLRREREGDDLRAEHRAPAG